MSYLLLILLLMSRLSGQIQADQAQDETADPDILEYNNALLGQLFHPLDIETADPLRLRFQGFSEEAIDLITIWQSNGAASRSYNKLKKTLEGMDAELLTGTIRGSQTKSRTVIRQKLQYSAALEGWRILQKGRLQSPIGSLIFLIEQDPGESLLTDHIVFCVSSPRVPGIERLILGDFHMRWGSGLLLNQSGSRLGMSPRSMARPLSLILTPHYSSRERDYFHGIAAEWKKADLQLTSFFSRRTARGQFTDNTFREDSDGIHLLGKSYSIEHILTTGLAGIYSFSQLQIYLAALVDSRDELKPRFEYGLHWQVNHSQFLQIYSEIPQQGSIRSVLSWTFSTQIVQLAGQYRYYPCQKFDHNGSIISVLGSSTAGEQGFSARLQIRPVKQLLICYTIDNGAPAYVNNLTEERRVSNQKVQIVLKESKRKWQLDWNHRLDGPEIPEEIWTEHVTNNNLDRLAVSLNEKISQKLQYRLNIKAAQQAGARSILFQQRILWSTKLWIGAVGLVRYSVPAYALRLSVYESSLQESFSFFTAYNDGQHGFVYVRTRSSGPVDLEFRITQTENFGTENMAKQLELGCQLSVVL